MDTKKNTKPKACECGCEGMTRGGRFLPGHDAKLKRALIEAALGGSKRAESKIEKLGWAKFLEAKRERDRKASPTPKPAAKRSPRPSPRPTRKRATEGDVSTSLAADEQAVPETEAADPEG